MEKFRQLLYDLGDLIAQDLFIDEHGVCRLFVNEKFPIQLESDQSEEMLYFIAPIAEVPPGRFREQVLKEAMKENEQTKGCDGTLGYVFQKNLLTFCFEYPFEQLTGTLLADLLEKITPKIEAWYDALARGSAGPNPQTPLPKDKPPQFTPKL